MSLGAAPWRIGQRWIDRLRGAVEETQVGPIGPRRQLTVTVEWQEEGRRVSQVFHGILIDPANLSDDHIVWTDFETAEREVPRSLIAHRSEPGPTTVTLVIRGRLVPVGDPPETHRLTVSPPYSGGH